MRSAAFRQAISDDFLMAVYYKFDSALEIETPYSLPVPSTEHSLHLVFALSGVPKTRISHPQSPGRA